eukprot:4879683-Pleurochrysis_carterae.AAC.1
MFGNRRPEILEDNPESRPNWWDQNMGFPRIKGMGSLKATASGEPEGGAQNEGADRSEQDGGIVKKLIGEAREIQHEAGRCVQCPEMLCLQCACEESLQDATHASTGQSRSLGALSVPLTWIGHHPVINLTKSSDSVPARQEKERSKKSTLNRACSPQNAVVLLLSVLFAMLASGLIISIATGDAVLQTV